MKNALRGGLCVKGEKGDSAYTIACKNGFIGTERDFLAQLGTSSKFEQEKVVYETTEGQTTFDISEIYTSGDFIDVRTNGFSLNANEYIVDTDTREVRLLNQEMEAGQTIEIVITTMSTANFPIVETINESSTNDTTPSTKAVHDYVQAFINTVYPVGSIYMSVNETSPEVLFGGTWEQIKDRFLLSAGDTYAAGSTGGEAAHKLDLTEMPNHRHGVANYNTAGANLTDRSPVMIGETRTGWEGSVFTSYEGGGEAHNNMPPYLTVFTWKRIA